MSAYTDRTLKTFSEQLDALTGVLISSNWNDATLLDHAPTEVFFSKDVNRTVLIVDRELNVSTPA